MIWVALAIFVAGVLIAATLDSLASAVRHHADAVERAGASRSPLSPLCPPLPCGSTSVGYSTSVVALR